MARLILRSLPERQAFMARLKDRGIMSVFHYLPLHISAMGRRFGGKPRDCPVTEEVSDRLVRLPLYNDLSERDILTVPAHPSLWSYFDEAVRHKRRYAPAALERRLVEGGYEVEYLTQLMASLYPIAWVSRRLAGRKAAAGVHELAEAELRVVPVVNGILNAVTGCESPLIARRVRVPVGTSLLLLARKRA